jgi:hypothetical protein
MSDFFPSIDDNVTAEEEVQAELPLYREVAWDYENDIPLVVDGELKIITGKEAIKVWIYHALRVERYRYLIYSWDYGNEMNNLIGADYTKELITSEVTRYINECVLINPYITDISSIETQFDGGKISVQFVADTIYGEVEINV